MRWSARLNLVAIVSGLAIMSIGGTAPVQAQGLPSMRYLAVTSLRDYFGDLRSAFHSGKSDESAYYTRTILVAINGSMVDASVATYVLGGGQLFRHEFTQISSGDEAALLPMRAFGSDPNCSAPPLIDLRYCRDLEIPPYIGETIVVASNVPVLVTGAVFRGFVAGNNGPIGVAESRRTLDVRQFDCSNPTDFQKIPRFCETFLPVPPR
jgi:hypothetical protein